ncbi:MAG TPA: MFS transporter [Rhodocyclaceae bacterium]
MRSPANDAMTRDEKSAGAALASIFALRMLGLFLILPVFAVHAKGLPGGDNLTLVGIAIGAYGLTQAMFQIPFGMASDRFGRKPVIVAGLVLFAIGSAVAALAPDLHWIIVGRVLQGGGAISAAVTALAADLTREQHRTKVMAMIGSSIGLAFAFSLVAAPALYSVVGMAGIFWLTAILAVGAIFVLKGWVGEPPPPHPGPPVPFGEVLRNGQLLRLNFGIFVLHMAQMAMFVVIPRQLVSVEHFPVTSHWKLYLPAVLASFVLMVPAIIMAERRGKVKPIFVGAVLLLLLTEGVFYIGNRDFWWLATGLLLFFVAFNILEATLPSLISRFAPARAKGAALGVYNTTQAFGLFLGGALGGYLANNYGVDSVFVGCGAMVALWVVVASGMGQVPQRVAHGAAPVEGKLDPL